MNQAIVGVASSKEKENYVYLLLLATRRAR
jgi:hypothetical protein